MIKEPSDSNEKKEISLFKRSEESNYIDIYIIVSNRTRISSTLKSNNIITNGENKKKMKGEGRPPTQNI